ncbi:MAG: class I SAM-dependent methyltransferase [Planctomycetes bacterium]|nr:class I SAM-dependent methyltransferase [Planctomycetota bacterium]
MVRVALLADEFRPDVRDDLARRLGIPVAIEGSAYAAAIGAGRDGAPEIVVGDGSRIRVELATRRRSGDSPLLRATGVGRGVHTIFDATAGLGRDAAELLAAGCAVVLCEREPWLAGLLELALQRAGLEGRCRVIRADAIEVMRSREEPRPDAVFLDPMYAPSGKRALPKAPAQALRELCERTPTSESDLLDAARRFAVRRVVVKRHPSAEPLAGERPPNVLRSKSVRFDIYPPLHGDAEPA